MLILSNLRNLTLTAIAIAFFWISGSAQCVTYTISVKGDTINCKDANGLRQGPWVNRFEEVRGEPGYEEEGMFENDKKVGFWRLYTLQGDLMGIENYRYGHKNGLQQYFNTLGILVREESWLASNPDNPTETVEVFDINDPKKVYLVQVKLEASTVPHGIWKSYDPQTGRIVEKQNFILGKPDDGSGTANGIIKNKDTATGRETMVQQVAPKQKPKPKEVQEYEKKNEGKKKIKVRTGQTGG